MMSFLWKNNSHVDISGTPPDKNLDQVWTRIQELNLLVELPVQQDLTFIRISLSKRL